MTLFVTGNAAADMAALGSGTIGVFYVNAEGEEICAGNNQFVGDALQIAAFGDDATTPEKDGFSSGESIIWKFQDLEGNQFILTPAPADGFVLNGISFIASVSYDAVVCLEQEVLGCTDENYLEFNPDANIDDNSCETYPGCIDVSAFNYNSDANSDDGSCVALVEGCTNITAFNYNLDANTDDGSCEAVIEGCTDITAFNYNELANTDDLSCIATILGLSLIHISEPTRPY